MTVNSDRTASRADGLRYWARGLLAHEAAVELLIGFNGGRLVRGPWIRPGGFGSYWLDAEVAAAESGYLSGGERRVLALATSLVSSDHPVDLGDAITGIDHDALTLVLKALAHAGGLPSPVHPQALGLRAERRPPAPAPYNDEEN